MKQLFKAILSTSKFDRVLQNRYPNICSSDGHNRSVSSMYKRPEEPRLSGLLCLTISRDFSREVNLISLSFTQETALKMSRTDNEPH